VKLILRKYLWKHIVIVALLIMSSKTIYENWSNFIHNLIYSSRDITKRYPRTVFENYCCDMLPFRKRMVPYRLLRASLSQQVNPVPWAIQANLTIGNVSRRYCAREIIIKYKWIKFMTKVHVRAPSMHFIVVFPVKQSTLYEIMCSRGNCLRFSPCHDKFFESSIKGHSPSIFVLMR